MAVEYKAVGVVSTGIYTTGFGVVTVGSDAIACSRCDSGELAVVNVVFSCANEA